MEETASDQTDKKIYANIKILTPGGCLPLPRGYIDV